MIVPPAFPVWGGVADFADGYEAFILDLLGVLHDGVTAYPGARDTLLRLKGLGKRVVLLSNAPRRNSGRGDGVHGAAARCL